jgi:Ca-activated chloride channel family protein
VNAFPFLLALLTWMTAPEPSADQPAVERPPIAASLMGRVTDADSGRPLPGARISLDGSGPGALSDTDGRWSIRFGDGWVGRTVTVHVRLFGFSEATRTLTLSDGVTVADFVLRPSAVMLDQAAAVVASEALSGRTLPMAVAQAAPEREWRLRRGDFNTESYDYIDENPFLSVRSHPLSTFSIDVDRASYANVRRFIRDAHRPPVDAVRIEELINYFTYDDPAPSGDIPFSVTTEVIAAPWQPLHRLVRIGLKGTEVDVRSMPPNNLVFLLDVSGSMNSPDKLPLLKTAVGMLVDQLRPQDRVAIVVYAGASGLVLESTPGNRKNAIREAIDRLQAGGSTAGGAGLELAYRVAARNHMRKGNNRVILATDGDFNVGLSSDAEMVRLIESRRDQGTFLTVMGFGTGNLKDSKMEKTADRGNGNYHYIDSALEARKVLVEEMGGTLLTIAKDVKIQVEFNPARVAAYRLIGYENRLLAAEDFDDDRKDAGELGAGHSVTALYEVVPVDVDSPVEVRQVGELRYGGAGEPQDGVASPELLFVKLRYKRPSGVRGEMTTHPVLDGRDDRPPSDNARFAAAVAAWGMLLRDSEQCGSFTLADVERLAAGALGADVGGYRAEFLDLVRATRELEILGREPGT